MANAEPYLIHTDMKTSLDVVVRATGCMSEEHHGSYHIFSVRISNSKENYGYIQCRCAHGSCRVR